MSVRTHRYLADHVPAGVVCSDCDLIGDDGRRLGVRDHDVNTITSGVEYIGQTIRSGRSSIGISGAMVLLAALGDLPLWFRVAENWEVGHITASRPEHMARTLFEIMDYRLTPGQFEHALELMRADRTDARDYLTFATLSAMIRLRLTAPLGWVARYHPTLRSVLGLK